MLEDIYDLEFRFEQMAWTEMIVWKAENCKLTESNKRY